MGTLVWPHIGVKIWDKLDPKYLDIVFLNGHQDKVERSGIKGLENLWAWCLWLIHDWSKSVVALSRSQIKWGACKDSTTAEVLLVTPS